MKIYSWNIWDVNKDFDRALEYISELEFDVLCLQEVPAVFLSRLKKLPYNIEWHIDLKRYKKGKWVPIYLIVLTKHKITGSEKFYTGRDWKPPLRTRAFISFMRIVGWTKNDAYGALAVDIQKGKKKFRVFSLHLHVGKPLERIKQFKETFKHLKSGVYNIVCGDFNTADTPYLQPFNWIMGSSLKEALPFYPERKNLEKLFGDYGLKNPLRGQRTHVANCQLDHILVPTPVKVLKKGVQKDPVGSDHKPVFVEINRITPSCQALTVGKTI